MKRLFDIVASGLGLLMLSPFLLIMALLVRLLHGSPVLFRQKRPGLGGKIFEILKFRTMTNAMDSCGELMADGERITTLGRLLRLSSMDELPELWNVFKGDMSLVGPRPLLVEYLDRYTSEQVRRHEVRPGITGWAQVNGRNAIEWEEKFRLDVWYVDNRSFWLDIKILLMTAWNVLRRKGVSAEGHATMPEFRPGTEGEQGEDLERPASGAREGRS